ncbi:MAG: chromate transporter [Atopobiaceae bacterium]|nr:chromate transporter [Atopobiaceae bacterium]
MTDATLLFRIFVAFLRVGAMAFGGAYAAIPLVEQEVVAEAGFMEYSEFADLLALDEITPGPILINSATFVGMRVAGLPGAVVATLACVLIPCTVAIALLFLFRRFKETTLVQSAVLTLKCMALALIASTMAKLAMNAVKPDAAYTNVAHGAYAAAVMCIAFYLMHWKKLSPLPVMLGCGAMNVVAVMLGM